MIKIDIKTFTLAIIFLLNQYTLVSQTKAPRNNKGWEIIFSPGLAIKENIKPDYLNTPDLDVYSRRMLGLDLNISRSFSLSDKSYLSIGAALGKYKAGVGYSFNKNLLDSIKLISNFASSYDNGGSSLYFSLTSKYNYSIFKKNVNEFFVGIGVNLNYIKPSFYKFGDRTSHLILNGNFNDNKQPFLSGTISISYRCQISDRLYFVTGLSQNYSPSIVFNGSYKIYTKTNIVSGNIEKQFSQTQINLGLFKSFTPKSYTPKKTIQYKLECDSLDFYGKGWGMSFTSYIVPKFSVVQNPTSTTTLFYSKPRLSYKGEFSKLTPLSKKSFLKMTLAYGNFMYDQGLKVEQSESISGKAIDVYEKFSPGMRYLALTAQYNYVLFTNEYQALTMGLGASVNRVLPEFMDDLLKTDDIQLGRTRIYYQLDAFTSGVPESIGRPFLSGVFDVSYWSKIDERFSFYVSPFVEIGDKKVMVGNYKIYGRKNTYEGLIHKKFQQLGLRLGVFYMLR